jgi:hypothetical protein
MAGVKGMKKNALEKVSFKIRMQKLTYEKLLKLKVVEAKSKSFNDFINTILVKHVVQNKILLTKYEIDYSDFE